MLQRRQKLTTQTLHSELVFNLAGSKHIMHALACFSVTDASSTLIVARFDASADDLDTLRALVKGTEAGLEALRDEAAMCKAVGCSDQEPRIGSLHSAVAGGACRAVRVLDWQCEEVDGLTALANPWCSLCCTRRARRCCASPRGKSCCCAAQWHCSTSCPTARTGAAQ